MWHQHKHWPFRQDRTQWCGLVWMPWCCTVSGDVSTQILQAAGCRGQSLHPPHWPMGPGQIFAMTEELFVVKFGASLGASALCAHVKEPALQMCPHIDKHGWANFFKGSESVKNTLHTLTQRAWRQICVSDYFQYQTIFCVSAQLLVESDSRLGN